MTSREENTILSHIFIARLKIHNYYFESKQGTVAKMTAKIDKKDDFAVVCRKVPKTSELSDSEDK